MTYATLRKDLVEQELSIPDARPVSTFYDEADLHNAIVIPIAEDADCFNMLLGDGALDAYCLLLLNDMRLVLVYSIDLDYHEEKIPLF